LLTAPRSPSGGATSKKWLLFLLLLGPRDEVDHQQHLTRDPGGDVMADTWGEDDEPTGESHDRQGLASARPPLELLQRAAERGRGHIRAIRSEGR
jgi:hypothetical protein